MNVYFLCQKQTDFMVFCQYLYCQTTKCLLCEEGWT
jgi:hypothetical protein